MKDIADNKIVLPIEVWAQLDHRLRSTIITLLIQAAYEAVSVLPDLISSEVNDDEDPSK